MYENFKNTKRKVLALSETDSTNNVLKELIKESREPLFAVVSAEKQTGGRGRLGRSFFSPEGGLYFSVSLPLKGDENNVPFITLLAGLSVNEAIRELTGEKTEIKWPNDIYLNGKKLGGILCELVSMKGICAVAGMGINLSVEKNDIPRELLSKMTSFVCEGLSVPDKNALMNRITQKLDKYIYEDKELYEVNEKTLESIKKNSYSIGKRVRYTVKDTVLEGTVTDIKRTGAAEITLDDKTVKEIFFGEITQ